MQRAERASSFAGSYADTSQGHQVVQARTQLLRQGGTGLVSPRFLQNHPLSSLFGFAEEEPEAKFKANIAQTAPELAPSGDRGTAVGRGRSPEQPGNLF